MMDKTLYQGKASRRLPPRPTLFIQLILTLLALFYFSPVLAKTPNAFDIYDKPIYLSDYSGKTIILVYWSETCEACLEEIPELNRIALMTNLRPIALFAININKLPNSDQQSFAAAHGMHYTLLANNPFTHINFDDSVEVLPTLFIIPPNGNMTKLEGTHSAEEILNNIRF